jgi:hypothetical protein
MGIAKEATDEMLKTLLEAAKHMRAALKYSDDEKMVPMAIIISPHKDIQTIPMEFRDEASKRRITREVAQIACDSRAQAVVVICDSRWANSDKLAAHFNMKTIKETGLEAFQEEYHRIIEQYGGEIKNLPREVWSEAVCVAIKGPSIETRALMAAYIEGPGDTVEYDYVSDESPQQGDGPQTAMMGLIPDWWIRVKARQG